MTRLLFALMLFLPGLAFSDETATALSLVNEARKHAGLEPVVLDETLSRGCRLHAEYLAKNEGRKEIAGLRAHEEDPKLPGYTKEGAHAGKNSDIAQVPLPAAVGQWVNSLYHRTPILQPSLKKVGMAHARGAKGQFSVLMFDPAPDDGRGYPVAFPADGQTGVPLTFSGEIPDPVPQGGGPTGSPVTIAFGRAEVRKVTATLTDASGVEIPVHLSTPEKPATSFPQGNVVCLIPKKPMRPATTYCASIKARVNGSPFERVWSFTTSAPIAIDAADTAALAAAMGKLATLRGDVQAVGTIPGYSYLQIAGRGKEMVSVLIPDASWPEFRAAGFDGAGSFTGKRVEATGVPSRTDSYVNVEVFTPADLRVVALELPVLDATGPEPAKNVGKLVRLRGRVRHAGTIAGYVFFQIGESDGRMVSVFVKDASWKSFGLEVDALAGKTVTAQGVLRLEKGQYLNITAERPDQLVWEP